MWRRKRGFSHLKKMKGRDLYQNLPKNVPKNQSISDLERVLTIRGYHSEEISETDKEKADRERRDGIRQENDHNDRVIKVLDKNWRSPEVLYNYWY